MADKKITELPELNSLSDDDLLVVLDDPSVTPNTYKITWANILATIASAVMTFTNKTLTSPVIDTGVSGTAILDEDTMASNSATQLATQQSIKAYVDANKGILNTTSYAPSGFLINGKIVPSVTSNDLTVAIKGMDGNDPSSSNVVYVRIGDTVRTLTSALSLTAGAGTNWLNLGSTKHATKETDLFVYLTWDSSAGALVLSVHRMPYLAVVGDFTQSSTSERGVINSTIGGWTSTDDMVLIGRFAATLSAGAGYTWSIPALTTVNLIQRPIYTTRWMTYVPTISFTAGAAPSTPSFSNLRYRLNYNSVDVEIYMIYSSAGTTVTAFNISVPFGIGSFSSGQLGDAVTVANGGTPILSKMQMDSTNFQFALSSSTVDRFGFTMSYEL